MVALDGGVEARGDKSRRVAEEVDVLVDLLDDFERQFRNQRAIGDQEDRHLLVAVTLRRG